MATIVIFYVVGRLIQAHCSRLASSLLTLRHRQHGHSPRIVSSKTGAVDRGQHAQ